MNTHADTHTSWRYDVTVIAIDTSQIPLSLLPPFAFILFLFFCLL